MYRNKLINYLSKFLLLTFLLTSATAIFAQKIVESSEDTAGFSFSTDSVAVEPIIHYQQNIQMLSAYSDMPTVSIYGDGRVLVHYPVYMKKAGDYEMQLSGAELESLIQTLSNDGIMNFDGKKIKEKIQASKKGLFAKGQLPIISDDVLTIVDIRLDEYQKNSASSKQKNFHKQLKWKNIEHDAVHYKLNRALVRANNSIKSLHNLKSDARLVRKAQQ